MQSTGRAEVGSPPLPRISAYCFISVPEVRVTKEGEGEGGCQEENEDIMEVW